MSTDLYEAAYQLHHLAKWADTHAAWIEPSARCPNDDADPSLRTVPLDAVLLDDFLNGLRRLGPELERLAQVVERPRLRLVSGRRA